MEGGKRETKRGLAKTNSLAFCVGREIRAPKTGRPPLGTFSFSEFHLGPSSESNTMQSFDTF